MRKRIRILAFFLLSYPEYGKIVGGNERRFLELSSCLTSLGAEIFTLEYKPSLSRSWGYSSYRGVELSRRFKNHTVLETVRLIVHGLRCCIQFKCDIIYVPKPDLWSPFSFIPPYVVSLLCRKPLVIVFHHLRPTDTKERNPIRLLAYMRAKTCIAVSQATAKDVRRVFKINRLIVTGNGVNHDKFLSSNSQQLLYDVVYFGRIAVEKGVLTLLEAWKLVIKKSPLAQLLLMGGIEENLKEELEKIFEKLGISRNVTFTGFVSDRKAIDLLNSSRIFVLPSTEEGFGLTVLEAMATGLPCILSDLPPFKENFASAVVLVKAGDAERLAQKILALLSNPEKCLKLAKRGQILARHFSWEEVANKELKVFKSLVKHQSVREDLCSP